MNKNSNYINLKKFCLQQSIGLFGVADVSAIKNDFKISPSVLSKLDKAVSLGVRLSNGVLQEIVSAPTKLYSHHYRVANFVLDQAAFRICNYIQNKGFTALAIPVSQILDWQSQTGHLSHKQIGVLAGLGWIGRNNLLVNEKTGAQLRLVTILTDMPLKTDKPSKQSCGHCKLCVQACPAGAIRMSPLEFDHIKCFEKIKEFQKAHLVEQYICGVCVNVCKGGKSEPELSD